MKRVRTPRKELGHLVAEDWIKTIWAKVGKPPMAAKDRRRLARNLVEELKLVGWESPRELRAQIQGWAEPQGHDRWRACAKIVVPLRRSTPKQADDLANKLAKFIAMGWTQLIKTQEKRKDKNK